MKEMKFEQSRLDRPQEAIRLAALRSSGILDTDPEPGYDAIARLAGEFFGADAALLGFADEGRVWIKACWGESVRELPRGHSIFEMVLDANGPVVVRDTRSQAGLHAHRTRLRQLLVISFASVPVRTRNGSILGFLTILSQEAREDFGPEAVQMLESLADLAACQLELRMLRRTVVPPAMRRSRPARNLAGTQPIWPRVADLRKALEERQFVLHYQPEVELSSRTVIGLEALIRWEHPERGLIPPMEFIPLAEETGLILPIGDWGMEAACRQIGRWCAEDPAHGSLRVSVNLSARQFSRSGLADHVESLLSQSGIASHQLGLEMTESSLIPNLNTAAVVLSSLRSLGVSLSMDDFGTGYSSLNHLHSFPFDVLKIDRSFVGRMSEGDQPMQIVRTIVELARALGMEVVAEGIETRQQYCELRKMGCRYGQGFLMARPMPAEAVTEVLRLPERKLPVPKTAGCKYACNPSC